MGIGRSPRREVRKSLGYGIADGSSQAAMLGLTQDYTTPFALTLGASVMQVGLLASIPSLSAALAQLAAPMLAEMAGSRKKVILPAVFLHALAWLSVLLVPFLFGSGGVWWLIGLLTLGAAVGSFGNPAWGSLISDLVPGRARGRYFGLRGQISGLVTIALFIAGGIVLRLAAADIFTGFAVLFGGAAVFRLASWYFLSRTYEQPLVAASQNIDTKSILKNLTRSNLGRFMLAVSSMNFAAYLAAPFFSVFMLRDLGFSYITYVAVIGAGSLSGYLFMPFWGRRTDSAGNVRVLKLTSLFLPVVPVLWLAGHQIYYLIPLQLLSGFVWAGFNLAGANFIYEASAPGQRMRYIAVANALNGCAMCLGALVGGFIAPHLPPVFGRSILCLFLVSGLLRAGVCAWLFRGITEVRPAGMDISDYLRKFADFVKGQGFGVPEGYPAPAIIMSGVSALASSPRLS